MNKPIRIARHVYLRTQQRRLRHVRGVLIRNLTLPSHMYLVDPISISVYFTVHCQPSPEKVLFKSDPVKGSYSPSWESVQLTSYRYGHNQRVPSPVLTLGPQNPGFIIRVWVQFGGEIKEEEEEEHGLVFERKVELFDLSYLGLTVNKDGSGYPPNSVVVGMYEGLYSHPEVGGVPCAPKVIHSLTDYLPPQSLLEVQKREVVDSYLHTILTRIFTYQEKLNEARRSTRSERAKVELYLRLKRQALEKRNERERLITRLQIYKYQLKRMEEPENEESSALERVRGKADKAENELRDKQADLVHKREELHLAMSVFSLKREQMQRLKRNRHLRQRHMIYELANTFLIKDRADTYTICNVILPHADQLEQPSRVEQLGVALGYVAHLIHHLGKILFLPLLYPIRPQGSKSVILDLVSEETLIDNIKEFPLFAKGSEKALFQYAVFLLNKDIAQVRQHCGYGTSKTMFKRTLPNMKFLLDKLTRDVKLMMRGRNHSTRFNGRHQPHPDTMSITSSCIEESSVVSGSVVADSLPSPDADSLQSFSTISSQSSSMNPSIFTRTQQFLQHDSSNYPVRPTTTSTHPVTAGHIIDSRQIEHAISMDDLRGEKEEGEETDDTSGPESNSISLADLTKHKFTQQLNSTAELEEEQPSQIFFSPSDSVRSASVGEEDDEEEEEEREDSTTSSVPSPSTTPVVADTLTISESSPPPSASMLLSKNAPRGDDALFTSSLSEVEVGSSVVSGNLEDTLKSAVSDVTQLLLGQTPPEHIQITQAPGILSVNEANMDIESAQALRGLTAVSFAGQSALGIQLTPLDEAEKTERKETDEDDLILLQGPPTFPETLLPSRLATSSTGESTTSDNISTSPEWPRPRSMAQGTFSVKNDRYKTRMATPHIVGERAPETQNNERESSLTSSGKSSQNVNSSSLLGLADFIDRPSDSSTPHNNRNRFKQRAPDLFGPI